MHVQFDAALAERLQLAESDLETVRAPAPVARHPQRRLEPAPARRPQAFASCGAIESVQLPRTLDKAHLRGYGFVHFVDQDGSEENAGSAARPQPRVPQPAASIGGPPCSRTAMAWQSSRSRDYTTAPSC